MGKNDSGGTRPSDLDPSLPDNKAEAQAAKDAAKQSVAEKAWDNTKAKDWNDSLMAKIFGKRG